MNTVKPGESVRRYLDLSTGHVPKSEWDRMKSHEWPIVVDHDYGRFVWVGNEENFATDLPVLAALVCLARDLGCEWMNFDCDAAMIEELQIYEWE